MVSTICLKAIIQANVLARTIIRKLNVTIGKLYKSAQNKKIFILKYYDLC